MGYEALAVGCASTGDFAARLVACVSPDEWRQLGVGGFQGEVSAFNRAVLLRLSDCDAGSFVNDAFDADGVARMADMLQGFLEQHLPDNLRAQRWIVLSCLALAFVFREPLHPVEIVGAEAHVTNGETVYHCPVHEGGETLCGYCACRPM